MTAAYAHTGPRRAHSLILNIGADDCASLCAELRELADGIERNGFTKGAFGSPSVGGTYSYLQDPTMTHDLYFAALAEWLEKDERQVRKLESIAEYNGEVLRPGEGDQGTI